MSSHLLKHVPKLQDLQLYSSTLAVLWLFDSLILLRRLLALALCPFWALRLEASLFGHTANRHVEALAFWFFTRAPDYYVGNFLNFEDIFLLHASHFCSLSLNATRPGTHAAFLL